MTWPPESGREMLAMEKRGPGGKKRADKPASQSVSDSITPYHLNETPPNSQCKDGAVRRQTVAMVACCEVRPSI